MPGAIATIPRLRFSDGTSALAGGTVTVYAAGTTTPANTWQDRALTTLNQNPVPLDADGSCVIWLDSALSYKIVVKNSAGVTQWTQDNIEGGDVGDSIELAAPAIEAATAAAAASATAAEVSRDAIDNRIYPGTYAADPTTRPDGTASQNGDIYISSTAGAPKQLISGVWSLMTAASSADLANSTDAAKGSSLVGHRGSSVKGTIDLQLRRPRKVFSKLFATAAAVAAVKVINLGDSLAGAKWNQFKAALDRKMGGSSSAVVNTAGNGSGAGVGSAGFDLALGSLSSVVAETGQYSYWLTGSILTFSSGGSAVGTIGGSNPTFTTVKVYYFKEVGAGTINLVVGGSTVASASANAAAALGVLSYTQAAAQASVSINASGGTVRVAFAHCVNSGNRGVDSYDAFSIGGLLMSTGLGQAQARTNLQTALADIAPDLVTFEADDDFGDSSTNDAAFSSLCTVLDAACPNADKLVIGSTPRASNDAGKLAASNYLRGQVALRDASYLFFDSYYLLGSYSQMVAIFGADDGVHPNAAAQGYAADVLWASLGLGGMNLGYVPRAVNDIGTASKFAKASRFYGPGSNYLELTTDASFGVDWDLNIPRTLTVKKVADGSFGGWQFSVNTAVNPHVLPLAADFNTAGNVRKWDVSTSTGLEFTRFRKTDNPGGGRMHVELGLIRGGFTRAELLAISANTVLGSLAFCTDCTGGAQWVYARGGGAGDWVTVDGQAAI